MKLVIVLVAVLLAVALSYSAPQQSFGDFERSDDYSEVYGEHQKNSNVGLWNKFKNGTKNFFHRCIKLNSTVVQADDDENDETDFSLTDMDLTEIPITKENCWQYLKKIGRKGKRTVFGGISKFINKFSWNKQKGENESTTQRNSWTLKGTKTRVSVNETTENPSYESYGHVDVANFERSSN